MVDWSERYNRRGLNRYGRDEGIGQKIENWVESHVPGTRDQEYRGSGSYDYSGNRYGSQGYVAPSRTESDVRNLGQRIENWAERNVPGVQDRDRYAGTGYSRDYSPYRQSSLGSSRHTQYSSAGTQYSPAGSSYGSYRSYSSEARPYTNRSDIYGSRVPSTANRVERNLGDLGNRIEGWAERNVPGVQDRDRYGQRDYSGTGSTWRSSNFSEGYRQYGTARPAEDWPRMHRGALQKKTEERDYSTDGGWQVGDQSEKYGRRNTEGYGNRGSGIIGKAERDVSSAGQKVEDWARRNVPGLKDESRTTQGYAPYRQSSQGSERYNVDRPEGQGYVNYENEVWPYGSRGEGYNRTEQYGDRDSGVVDKAASSVKDLGSKAKDWAERNVPGVGDKESYGSRGSESYSQYGRTQRYNRTEQYGDRDSGVVDKAASSVKDLGSKAKDWAERNVPGVGDKESYGNRGSESDSQYGRNQRYNSYTSRPTESYETSRTVDQGMTGYRGLGSEGYGDLKRIGEIRPSGIGEVWQRRENLGRWYDQKVAGTGDWSRGSERYSQQGQRGTTGYSSPYGREYQAGQQTTRLGAGQLETQPTRSEPSPETENYGRFGHEGWTGSTGQYGSSGSSQFGLGEGYRSSEQHTSRGSDTGQSNIEEKSLERIWGDIGDGFRGTITSSPQIQEEYRQPSRSQSYSAGTQSYGRQDRRSQTYGQTSRAPTGQMPSSYSRQYESRGAVDYPATQYNADVLKQYEEISPEFGQYGRHDYGAQMGYGHEGFQPQAGEYPSTGRPQQYRTSEQYGSRSQQYRTSEQQTGRPQQYGQYGQSEQYELKPWGAFVAPGALPLFETSQPGQYSAEMAPGGSAGRTSQQYGSRREAYGTAMQRQMDRPDIGREQDYGRVFGRSQFSPETYGRQAQQYGQSQQYGQTQQYTGAPGSCDIEMTDYGCDMVQEGQLPLYEQDTRMMAMREAITSGREGYGTTQQYGRPQQYGMGRMSQQYGPGQSGLSSERSQQSQQYDRESQRHGVPEQYGMTEEHGEGAETYGAMQGAMRPGIGAEEGPMWRGGVEPFSRESQQQYLSRLDQPSQSEQYGPTEQTSTDGRESETYAYRPSSGKDYYAVGAESGLGPGPVCMTGPYPCDQFETERFRHGAGSEQYTQQYGRPQQYGMGRASQQQTALRPQQYGQSEQYELTRWGAFVAPGALPLFETSQPGQYSAEMAPGSAGRTSQQYGRTTQQYGRGQGRSEVYAAPSRQSTTQSYGGIGKSQQYGMRTEQYASMPGTCDLEMTDFGCDMIQTGQMPLYDEDAQRMAARDAMILGREGSGMGMERTTQQYGMERMSQQYSPSQPGLSSERSRQSQQYGRESQQYGTAQSQFAAGAGRSAEQYSPQYGQSYGEMGPYGCDMVSTGAVPLFDTAECPITEQYSPQYERPEQYGRTEQYGAGRESYSGAERLSEARPYGATYAPTQEQYGGSGVQYTGISPTPGAVGQMFGPTSGPGVRPGMEERQLGRSGEDWMATEQYGGVTMPYGARPGQPGEREGREMGQTSCLMANELGPYTPGSDYNIRKSGLTDYRKDQCGI